MQSVWFDRIAISNQAPEHIESVNSMCQNVSELIDKEVADGIPFSRIILGGFSMGGCLAMHLAYRYRTAVAGCFAMSSFLNKESIIYKVNILNKIGNRLEHLFAKRIKYTNI